MIFFGNGFCNSLIACSMSSFCLDNENYLNCTSGLVLLCFFYSPYLLITFFVLYKSRFSRLTSDLLHSLFQLNGFYVLSCIEFCSILKTVKVKRAKSKETGYTDKALSLSL